MTVARRLSAVVGLWLAAVAAVACALPATAAPTPAPTAATCTGVTVTVEFAQLGGGRRTACVDHGGTASALFAAAGFRFSYAPDMQDFVCTVDGLPRDRDCTTGTRYWSLWWSPGDKGWTYATLGVKSLEVGPGDSLAFVWHQGRGTAQPPSLKVGTTAATARATHADASADGGPGTTTWLAVAAGVLAVAAAAAVPLLRRRKAG